MFNKLVSLLNMKNAALVWICAFALGLLFTGVAFTQVDSLNITQASQDKAWEVGDIWLRIWSFEIFTIKDHPVRTSQLVIALLLLSLGLITSRWLTRRLGQYLKNHTQMDTNASALLEKSLYYSLFAIIILSTLQMIEIPITMFAFLGGAIAIAIGFGAQRIFNNFISGLILMIERPIRIDDLVEVDSNLGRIAEVGARCTRIRRVDGVEILVPNSILLESIIINRTLSDKKYRSILPVGVVYGSPIERVADILRDISYNHKSILSEPKPEVFFVEFGDSALMFELYFWVEVDQIIELRRIQSEVRFAIDKKFREENIVIAFPQRDLHIDTSTGPLDIRLIPPDAK